MAAAAASPARLAWAMDNPWVLRWSHHLAEDIVRHGSLASLQWAREHGLQWDSYSPDMCTAAARGGKLETLQWLREQFRLGFGEGTCNAAAYGGHLETLVWLRSEGCPWSAGTAGAAARGGQLHVLKWLREQKCPVNGRLCQRAAASGNLEALEWALQQCWSRDGVIPDPDTWGRQCRVRDPNCFFVTEADLFVAAAGEGHLEVIEWLIDRGMAP